MGRGSDGGKGQTKPGRHMPAPSSSIFEKHGPHAFKIACPESLTAFIMQNKGARVHQIQDETRTQLRFSARGEFYPTNKHKLRILSIFGAEAGSVMEAVMAVIGQTEEYAKSEDADRRSDVSDKPDSYIFRCILSKDAASQFIGPRGERVRRLRDSTNAQITIDREVYENNQLVTVSGPMDQLYAVVDELWEVVGAGVDEPWFPEWATHSFGTGGGKGGSGPVPPKRQREENGGEDGGARRPPKQGRFHAGLTVFVGGLTQATTNDDLLSHFSKFGEVLAADVKVTNTGKSKGFGFVSFDDPLSVQACLEDKANHNIDGRWVDVKKYETNENGGEEHAEANQWCDRQERQERPEPWLREQSWEDRSDQAGNGGRSGDPRGGPPPVDRQERFAWLVDVLESLPEDYINQQYSFSCLMPNQKCGGLIGVGGCNIREVKRNSQADVNIAPKDPNDGPDAYRSVEFSGNLFSLYGAHALLMKTYHEQEAKHQAEQLAQQQAASAREETKTLESLTKQVAELSKELEKHKAIAAGGGGGGGNRTRSGGRVPPRRP